jgi:hypothetical protein
MSYKYTNQPRNTRKTIADDRARTVVRREVAKEQAKIQQDCVPAVFDLTYNSLIAAMALELRDSYNWDEPRIQELIDGMMTWLKPLRDQELSFEEFGAKAMAFCSEHNIDVEDSKCK